MTWTEDICLAFENLGGKAKYSDLYTEIEKIRSELPGSWKKIIQRHIQDRCSESNGYKGKEDLFEPVLGIGSGVWALKTAKTETPVAIDLPDDVVLSSGAIKPGRSQVKTYRILRDSKLARDLKILHGNRCQICGDVLELKNGKKYSEAHHIKPLGKKHNGPDIPGNILVLCPNHHVLCDYGVIELNLVGINQVEGHEVLAEYLDYHNDVVCQLDES